MARVRIMPTEREDETLARLEHLGITRNEARIYVALLDLPRATAAELGEMSGVPRAKVYAVLRSLEKKGFALALGGQVARFQAVASEVALRGWIRHREQEREFANDIDRRMAEDLMHSLPHVEARDQRSTVAYIEAVSGAGRIAEISEQLLDSARERIAMVQQPPYFQAPSRWNKLEVAAVRRGVDVRVIYSRDALADERRYRPLLEAHANVRALDAAPMKLISIDGKTALVALRDPLTGEQGATSAIIHHPDLVAAIELLFEKEWERAEDLESVVPSPAGDGERGLRGVGAIRLRS
jgi:sugar-specific transcriptional regulator TrmB